MLSYQHEHEETESVADQTEPDGQVTRVFALINPVAGTSDASEIREALERSFAGATYLLELYETGADDDPVEMVRAALGRGCDLVVAAGGDGTISAAAAALVGTAVPLAVIASGTANVFARELGIPLALEQASALAAGPFALKQVDVMRTRDRIAILHIGVGIGSLMIRDTSREAKRRFGRLAYVWNLLRTLAGFQPIRYTVVADERRYRFSAAYVIVCNGATLGNQFFHWNDRIRPDDGVVDICIVKAQVLRDYLAIGWATLTGRQRRESRLSFLSVRRHVSINTRERVPVQIDGEIFGNAPVQIELLPGVLHVVVPEE